MRIMHVALGGCLSRVDIPFRATEDTGGHLAFVLGASAAQARRGDVDRVDLVTRAFSNPHLGKVYSRRVTRIDGKRRMLRLEGDREGYLEKDDLAAEPPALTRSFLDLLREDHRPDMIHAHFADAAELAIAARRTFGIPFLYTTHPLAFQKGRVGNGGCGAHPKRGGSGTRLAGASTDPEFRQVHASNRRKDRFHPRHLFRCVRCGPVAAATWYGGAHRPRRGRDRRQDVARAAYRSGNGRATGPARFRWGRSGRDKRRRFSWSSLPRSVILLGGGYIGCEFAAIFAALGVRVTVVEPGDQLLSGFDADLADAAAEVFEHQGIALHFRRAPERLAPWSGGFRLWLDDGSRVDAERVVAATGRVPNTDLSGGLGTRLDIAETGAFAVDSGFQTSAPGIFAIGDCADRLPLTPVATRDGEVLAQRLYGDARTDPIELALVATAVFVMPPVAQVGELEHGATSTGSDLICGALVPSGHWTGRTAPKIMAPDGKLRGVAAMGAGAPDIVETFGAVIAGDLRSATGIHPTFAEEFVGRD